MDAAKMVEGQAWASKRKDGRHFHKVVPMEVCTLPGLRYMLGRLDAVLFFIFSHEWHANQHGVVLRGVLSFTG